jgi:adenine/guanine/hypoxanthine permease
VLLCGVVLRRLESYFQFAELKTSWRVEILAGFTTFLTMAYIVFVNPTILGEAGMPVRAVAAATCFSAACGSLLMGALARYPIALAPGMGLNAYFTYTVVQGMGVSWQVALGAVFLSGLAFLLLTLMGVRRMIVTALPTELYAAVAAGIGLFIAFIGLRNAGIVAADANTLVRLGDLHRGETLLSLIGLVLIAALMAWGIRAAMLIGIVATSVLGMLGGFVHWQPQPYSWHEITATALQLDVRGALQLGLLEIVFVFLFVDFFDNLGTLVAVGKRAGLFTQAHQIPRIQRILYADGVATTVGSLAGTSTVVSYIESTAGVAAGGRSGVTAIVTGLLFLVALLFAPLAGVIPAAATAPALIVVGALMMATVAEINWNDPVLAVAAFLTMITIPLTFSIADGLAFGFTSYTLLRVARGQYRSIHWLTYLLTALFLLRFAYLGSG